MLEGLPPQEVRITDLMEEDVWGHAHRIRCSCCAGPARRPDPPQELLTHLDAYPTQALQLVT